MITRRGAALVAALGVALAVNIAHAPLLAAHAEDYPRRVASGGGEQVRRIKLGLNKSVIVELPRPARDVLVSNPEIADAVVRTQRRSFVIAKAVGQTNVFFFDLEGSPILTLEVEVAHDAHALQQTIRQLLPLSRIEVSSVADSIVLSGHAANALDADQAVKLAQQFIGDLDGRRVVNMMGIAGEEQVALKVTVAEMQRDTLKQLGVNLNAAAQLTTTSVLSFTSINPFTVTSTSPLSDVSLDYLKSGQTCLIDSSPSDPTVNQACAASVIRALERNGLMRTLAEPTLTAISGETASFLAGGEFPVPVGRDQDGNITIEFKEFGVKLDFTPIVLNDNNISLKIGSEVSELSNDNALILQGFNIPGLKVRRTKSTVELPSGGSLVLAGLIQEETKQELNGFPGLKDLPVLGALFRSREFQNAETELVVIATPYLVNPTARNRIARPDEGFAQPSDHEVTFMGRLNAVYGLRTGGRPSGQYVGDVGFIVK